MTAVISPTDVEAFRRAITYTLGLQLHDHQTKALADLLRQRLAGTGRDIGGYLSALGHGALSDELTALAAALAVPETYFFRHAAQFDAFADVIREMVDARGDGLRVLSAGCASGEEPYSLAMTLEDVLGRDHQVSIKGIDVNLEALRRARRGRFSPWSLRETPLYAQQKWFTRNDRDVLLAERIRAGVTFEYHNLATSGIGALAPPLFDIIFCRNVLMYLTPEATRSVVDRLSAVLAPGGYLFLGHAETLRGLSVDYRLRHTRGSFYYQHASGRAEEPQGGTGKSNDFGSWTVPDVTRTRKSSAISTVPVDGAGEGIVAGVPAEAASGVPAPGPGGLDGGAPGVETGIPTGTGTGPGPGPGPGPGLGPEPGPMPDLGAAGDLLRQERFSEALGLLGTLPEQAAADPDVLLLRATLLAHSGDLRRAEGVCRQLMDADGFSPGAHYLRALCREGAGDLEGAVEQDRVAAHLDPGFAMPHVHLAMMARRAGEVEAACREYRTAVALLQREDSARILLFGGGFQRMALITMCSTQLDALQGTS